MLAANFTTLRNNLKNYCDEVSDNNETVIVTRKKYCYFKFRKI